MNRSRHFFMCEFLCVMLLALLGSIWMPNAVYAKTFTPVYIDMKYPVEGSTELGLSSPAGVQNFESKLYKKDGSGWKETSVSGSGFQSGGLAEYKLAVKFYLNHKNESGGDWDKPSENGWGIHFYSNFGYDKKLDAENIVVADDIQSGAVAGYFVSYEVFFKALTKIDQFFLECPSAMKLEDGDPAEYNIKSWASYYYDVLSEQIKWFPEDSPSQALEPADKLIGGQTYDVFIPIKILDDGLFDESEGFDIYINDDYESSPYVISKHEYVQSERVLYARLTYVPVVRKIDSIKVEGIKTPQAGSKPQTSGIKLTCLNVNTLHPFDVDVEGDLKWDGDFDAGGNFISGKHYTLTVDYVIKNDPSLYDVNETTKISYTLNAGTVEESFCQEWNFFHWTVKIGLNCPKKKLGLKFDANGGSGTMSNVLVEEGSQYTLPTCGFTAPNGKEFDKWNKGAAGARITVNAEMTLVAQWKEKETETDVTPGPGKETEALKAAAEKVAGKVGKIPSTAKLTAADGSLVTDAWQSYKALSKEAKAYLPSGTYTKIEKARKQITILKAEAADKNSIKNREEEILSRMSDSDLAKSTFAPLKVKAASATQSTVTLSWSKVDGTAGYIVYGNLSGKTYKMKRLTTTTNRKVTIKAIGGKNLRKGKYYKFIVLGYKTKNGYKKCTGTSSVIHVCTAGGSSTNVKQVKPKESKKTLKKGRTWTVKASTVKKDSKKSLKKYMGLRFASSDKTVATVSSKGVVTAKKAGKANIYVYAQNGVCASVAVTVKTN